MDIGCFSFFVGRDILTNSGFFPGMRRKGENNDIREAAWAGTANDFREITLCPDPMSLARIRTS
jgi:hypothetical protein